MATRSDFARAGSSPRARSRQLHLSLAARAIAAHPRVCGADDLLDEPLLCDIGLSPRVRSRLPTAPTQGHLLRLIPACAEQTTLPPTPHRRRVRLIPACAEQSIALASRASLSNGQSPACAEQTSHAVPGRLSQTAHPRVCGADFQPPPRKDTCCGSSPRVRSRLFSRVPRMVGARLIPACAEQTLVGVVVS